MVYTENYNGVKLDVQAVDIDISENTKEVIHEAIDKMSRHTRDINFVDVYMKDEPHPVNSKTVRIRVGVPGEDAFADDAGEHFDPLIRSVTEKLIKQLEQKKAKQN
ncbi:HPF/RaiA family ribosome-associated protein [Taibaiella soli]|uniref:30S ribosomal protein S30 n=1 Tax=Taibaiella soli TaxID=1649169 RepID=A0A2W2BEI9_9BACT|nr:HPF/RaiA family ribosome-associated protein [Taibaiella soli]PZF74317.1 30S ribosomal protein S30 [Taibaiella soli]